MIEMRWIEKKIGEQTVNAIAIPGQIMNRYIVLQYREWPRGTISGNFEPDWVDVKFGETGE